MKNEYRTMLDMFCTECESEEDVVQSITEYSDVEDSSPRKKIRSIFGL